MPDTSALLGLPYLLPSQAQKHVTHNEALRLLDILVQLSVAGTGAETPPPAPAEGDTYILGAAPTGAWAGQPGSVAAWVDGAWLFAAPRPGWRAWDSAAGELRIWDGAGWVLPPAAPELDRMGVNATADAVNRLAVASDAALFTHDGAGHQLKINKAADGDTAALLFQSGFTGHAEIGLAGNTDFALKVSPDGAAWSEALSADAASGAVTLPGGIRLGGTGSDLLDTYESGAWTPEAGDAATGGATAGATTASGRYIRTGDQVFVCFTLEEVDTTGLAGGSDLFIRGLPYSARNHPSSRFAGQVRLSNVGFASAPFLYLSAGDAALRLGQNVSGGSPGYLAVSDLTSGTARISGSLTYRA